jgi:hypothetical protein
MINLVVIQIKEVEILHQIKQQIVIHGDLMDVRIINKKILQIM